MEKYDAEVWCMIKEYEVRSMVYDQGVKNKNYCV